MMYTTEHRSSMVACFEMREALITLHHEAKLKHEYATALEALRMYQADKEYRQSILDATYADAYEFVKEVKTVLGPRMAEYVKSYTPSQNPDPANDLSMIIDQAWRKTCTQKVIAEYEAKAWK